MFMPMMVRFLNGYRHYATMGDLALLMLKLNRGVMDAETFS